MRLLCVANRYPPWSIGGYERMTAAAVGALVAAGHEVRVLTTLPDPADRADDPPSERPETERALRWYWHNHAFPPLTPRQCLALERANAAILRARLDQFAPDAVVWWAMGGMSLSLLEQVRRAGLPALGVIGDEWMLYGPEVDGWIKLWSGRLAFAHAVAQRLTSISTRVEFGRVARWIFNSEYLREVVRSAGIELPHTSVGRPGVDADRFRPVPPDSWRWRLLYCGRVDPRKGVATAIEALAELPAEATLVVNGQGDPGYTAELGELAARLGVGDRVRFQSSDPDAVVHVYAAADAVVFPVTWREPWGLVPLEAMAVGRPVVASRAGGGPAEYLRQNVNCLQFEPGDAIGLAAALRRLAAEPQLRDALRDGGAATAARFTEGGFHQQLERELQALVEEWPARTRRRTRTGSA